VKQAYLKKRETCPVCDANSFSFYLEVIDDFLSKENFSISKCNNCHFLFTNPFPDESIISEYYKSDLYLSHPKSGFTLFGLLYNFIRSLNVHSKYTAVTKDLIKGNVLDIGCGSGDFLYYCKKKNWKVSGIEPNIKARDFASKRIGERIYEPKEQKEFKDKSFDLITLWHVLEHIENLDMQFLEVKRLMKKNGRLVIALPNHRSYDAQKYLEKWAAWDVPRHLHHFDIDTITLLANRNGFTLEKSIPMIWDSFYVSLLSEKYLKSTFPFFKAFINGCKSNIKAKKSGYYSSLIYVFSYNLVEKNK
jgi:ubiquinone/menaquinone biosynthesis C-methylase UbiE